ncbi:DUF1295 domain-containing protein, partial [Mycobacterium haemophilum]|uniref:DUF1295 domain-containing protein n=2 Tax=Mycobacterium haemophilum TaxID=29311 RepID=UPI0021F3A065
NPAGRQSVPGSPPEADGPANHQPLRLNTINVGVIFEAVGDRQLRVFKSDPANRGVIMDRGLWAWTRHPNYFGDACVWWGLWLITINGWVPLTTVVSPLVMTYFLVDVSGARLTEKYMKGRPGFAEYQKRTAYFVPRPPRWAPR